MLKVLSAEMSRDLVKGIAGLVANLILIHFLVVYTPLSPAAAPIVSLSVLLIAAYIATDQWTFRNRPSPESLYDHAKLLIQFLAAYGAGQFIKYVIYLLLLLYLPYLIGWVVASGTGFVISFGLSRVAWSRI